MIDPVQCKIIVDQQTIREAFEHLEEKAIKRVITGDTPEAREERFQELQGLKRLWKFLELKAAEAAKN